MNIEMNIPAEGVVGSLVRLEQGPDWGQEEWEPDQGWE